MNPRLAAARALTPLLLGRASLSSSLPPLLAKVTARDRALVQDLAFGTARWQPGLQVLLNRLLQKPLKSSDQDIGALLLIGLYQLFFSRIPPHAAIGETVGCAVNLRKSWAKGLLNAVLRRAQREQQSLAVWLKTSSDLVVKSAHPLWLQQKLEHAYPDAWQDICAANNSRPTMTLRVNRQQISREDYLKQLADADIGASLCRHSVDGILLNEPLDVQHLPGFAQGLLSVQDEAAQLAAGFLQLSPGQRVLDACAAPGGKTCHLLEVEPNLSQVLALDVDEKRLKRVEDNLQRLQLAGCRLLAADAREVGSWWDGTLFDRILLDAPCSGTGVIRRHPDIKLSRRPEDIDKLAQQQGELLDALWPCLKPGGLLLYVTCSVLPQENNEVIGAFLKRIKNAEAWQVATGFGLIRPQGLQLLPHTENGHDGFYYARLRKMAG
ncbi:16S rRNA methyltransferase [Ventosimonas gracilis]|uniref:16S rRNA (cytosine(967)-C(5))-methyltransferase n=1 Tax=Ventosimonas gracilis TaxID=1680762 RepID=A0A139SSP2_9GAMM|nr:16S rRNA (cytosine(967)-C(5))-methyltransferase RsmB [Ventosimonas gracilis]KXU37491.1 16S rRNA methyltransferase [Ventosimonas gracilis]